MQGLPRRTRGGRAFFGAKCGRAVYWVVWALRGGKERRSSGGRDAQREALPARQVLPRARPPAAAGAFAGPKAARWVPAERGASTDRGRALAPGAAPLREPTKSHASVRTCAGQSRAAPPVNRPPRDNITRHAGVGGDARGRMKRGAHNQRAWALRLEEGSAGVPDKAPAWLYHQSSWSEGRPRGMARARGRARAARRARCTVPSVCCPVRAGGDGGCAAPLGRC